jgi:hypothetical protein
MYIKGQLVRLESTNELRTIKNLVTVGNKTVYVCDDNVWYDESLLYPHDMKFQIKDSMNEKHTLSDYGKRDDVINEMVSFFNEDEENFNEFLNLIENYDFDFDDI